MKNRTQEMIKARTGENLRTRELEKSYFVIYCLSTKISIDDAEGTGGEKKLYVFFGCGLGGKKKYISSVLEEELIRTSDWYNYFQTLKKRGMEHVIYALVPKKKEIRDAIKLSYPKVEIFTSCENTINKLQKYNTFKTRDEIYREVRKLYIAKDLIEYELNYKEFVDKYSKYPFIMDLLNEEIKSLKENYKYSFAVRRIIYAFNYIIEMERRFEKINRHEIFKDKEEFVDICAFFIYSSEAALHYQKEEWANVLNEIYEEKKDLIKPYL